MNPILKTIAETPVLFDALKDAILSQFAEESVDEKMTDEQIGQISRARSVGRRKVEKAFSEIARLRTSDKENAGVNPGR